MSRAEVSSKRALGSMEKDTQFRDFKVLITMNLSYNFIILVDNIGFESIFMNFRCILYGKKIKSNEFIHCFILTENFNNFHKTEISNRFF